MTIEIHCEKSDIGTPIEIASAIINYIMGRSYSIEFNKQELAEIAEHIATHVKYCKTEGI